ncbi:MAG: energy-coupling factor transporter transmembrane component T [Syntrophomonadaceae bacterium]|nr:energy-coupling factor transporter transmembrane component T [Syntrophomonadaceae bacterium]
MGLRMGQYLPLDSPIHRLDPRTKLLVTILLGLASFKAPYPWGLIIIVSMILILVAASRVPLYHYWQDLRPFVLIILITAAIQLFLTPGDYLIGHSPLIITQQGIAGAMGLFMRITGILLLARWLTATTRPVQLTNSLETLLHPLRRIGLPLHELLMIMTLSLSFIPLLGEETVRIQRAQTTRGANLRSGNLLSGTKRIIAIIVPLLRGAMQRAAYLAEAMEDRGYEAGGHRTHLYQQKLALSDYGLFTVVAAAVVLIL